MNRRLVFWTACSAVLLSSVVAYGQERQRGAQQRGGQQRWPGTIGLTQLVANRAVQKEIEITDEQKTELRELAGQRGERPNFQEMSAEERQEFLADRRKRAAEAEKKLGEILDEGQMTRLKEIHIQAMGAAAIMDPEVSKALGITDEQRKEIRETGAKIREKYGEAMADRSNREAMAEAMAKVQEDLKAALSDLLSDEQKATLKEMTGKPFDVSALRGGRGGRPGGAGGRGGAAGGGRRRPGADG